LKPRVQDRYLVAEPFMAQPIKLAEQVDCTHEP